MNSSTLPDLRARAERQSKRGGARILARFGAAVGFAFAATGAAWAGDASGAATDMERAAIAAFGFHPEDPIAVAEYREELAQSSPFTPLAAGDFVLDTSWNPESAVPGVHGDRFAGSDYGLYEGIKAAKLPNGNIVVASYVMDDAGNTYLGLTQMNSAGHDVAWAHPNPNYAAGGNQYILYPKNNPNQPPVFAVKDLKVYGNHIYVLVTGHHSDGIYQPNIIRFNLDGSDAGWWYANWNGNPTSDAVAMDIYQDHLVVLGRHSATEGGGFWTVNFELDDDGALGDMVFANFRTPPPHNNDNADPVDIAFERKTLIVYPVHGPRYYVLYTYQYGTTADRDPCLLAVKGDGTPDTSFPVGGLHGGGSVYGGGYCKYFNDVDSNRDDRAVALTTNAWGTAVNGHEGIQVLVKVARAEKDGAGMWEFLDNADHPNFGTSGRIVFGGCGHDSNGNDIGEGCFQQQTWKSFAPTDLEFSGSDEIVSGDMTSTNILFATQSPAIYRIHGDSGVVEQYATFPSGYAGGNGWLNSVVARDDHHLVGIGEAIDPSLNSTIARTQITVGMTNLDDVIFKDGFD